MPEASPRTTDASATPSPALGIAKGSKRLFWYGLAMCVAGIFALAFPGIATLVTIKIVGWLLIFGGVARVVQAFSFKGGHTTLHLALGVLEAGIGAYIVFNPVSGAVAITLMIAAIFLVEGAFETVFALQLRPAVGWGWMLSSGLIGIAAGAMISFGPLGTSVVLIGILVGVSFLSSGIASMSLSRAVARARESERAAA